MLKNNRENIVKNLYQSGLGIKKVSKKTGLSRSEVIKILGMLGIKLRKSRRDLAIKYHPPIKEINKDSSELLALHAGDGCLCSDGRWLFSVNKSDKALMERIIFLVRKVVGVEPTINRSFSINKIDLGSGQKQTVEYFATYFPIGKKSYIVQLPEEIMKSDDPDIIKGSLRGLFSSDGCFSFRKRKLCPRIEFRVKSRVLRDQFIELAKKANFKFNKSNPKHRTGIIHTAYLERINTAIRWMEEIGSSSEIHMKRFNLWMQLKFGGGTRAWSKLGKAA